ncbi:MAG TPA: glycine oxidase ThiO [Solirubrobacteraceae bacterium]
MPAKGNHERHPRRRRPVGALDAKRLRPAAVDRTDVLVIGAGLIGLSVAWRAAQRGARVTVLEAGAVGAGASHVAAGMLAPVTEAEVGDAGRRLLELSLASLGRWPAFAAELREATGIDVGLRRTGALVLARDGDEAEALERELAFRRELGLGVERLRPSEARRREPALAPTLRLALDVPGDASVDPRRVLEALVAACRAHGVEVREGARVGALDELGAERVVVAAGAWSAQLVPDVPVRPVKGQLLRLRDPRGPGLVERVLRFEGGYLVPRGDGGYVLGATMEERGYDTTVTAGGLYELLRDAHELVPGVSELVVEETLAGLRPGTPDNLPIVEERDGVVLACGHGRNGVLLAPLTAELVAELLAPAAVR